MGRRSRQTEVEGLKLVQHALAQLGWRSFETPSNSDVGTDLYADLFDDRGHSLRLHIGAQVKSGPYYFKRRRRGKDEGVDGWWYKDGKRRHFDFWTTSAVAHVLVLADVANEVAYWVHVTPEAVKSTGKGAKILVPRSQTITSEQADALVEVAARQKAAPQLQGLAFTADIHSVPLGRRLRYALMAPRLVVPSRTHGFETAICAEEAIALIASGRFRDLRQFADANPDVPDPDATDANATWPWQFVAAFWEWAAEGTLCRLKSVFDSSSDSSARAATGVLLACALRRQEQHIASTEVLDQLVEPGSLEPADHGWVLVQRAHNKIEADDVEGADADAAEAQRSFAGDRDDITVSALSSSATWVAYYAASMRRFESGEIGSNPTEEQRRYEELLVAFDTAVSWWRSQEVSSVLGTEQDESFRNWAQDRAMQEIVYGSTGEDRLFAAELNADLTAEHSAWRSVAERRGKRLLMRASKSASEQHDLTEGLDLLRRCGAQRSLGRAIGHLLRVGPADAIAQAMRRLPMTGWTSTTVAANFEALKLSGHFLDEDAAGELLLSCTRFAHGDSADLPRCDLTSLGLTMAALEGAAGLMPAASDALHSPVARDLAELPSNAEHAYSMCIKGLIDQLEWDHVAPADRERLRELAERDNARAVTAVLGWFSNNGDDQAHFKLRCLAADAELHAVSALASLSDLSDTQADDLLGALGERARNVLSDAQRGTRGADRDWVVGSLVRACATFPGRADWDDVFALLVDPAVATETKRVLCAAAHEFAGGLPDEVRQRFASCGDETAQLSPIYRGDGEIGAVPSLLLCALDALSDSEAQSALIGHAVGTPLERRDAARLALALGSDTADTVLVMLAQDKDFAVRSKAAYCVGRRVAKTDNNALDSVTLQMARSGATYLQLSLLNGLSATDSPRRAISADIAEHLRTHPSALVRRQVSALERDS